MDRAKVRDIRAALQALDVSEIEDRFGIKIEWGSARFAPVGGNATFKVQIAEVVDGQVKTKEAVDFERYRFAHQIQVEALGREFAGFDGTVYILKGYRRKARKRPILAEEKATGRLIVFPVAHAKLLIERSVPELGEGERQKVEQADVEDVLMPDFNA